jgi:hypothetical protein
MDFKFEQDFHIHCIEKTQHENPVSAKQGWMKAFDRKERGKC